MGMTINEAIEVMEYLKTQNSQLHSLDVAIDTMRKYQMMQADYNARLKAELKDIREEILALYRDRPLSYNHRQRTEFCDKVLFILDKKISELEGRNDTN